MAMTHIIGAGIAGLAAAVYLARSGRKVALYETAGQAGGRCRSFHDKTLNTTIDNGNHLLLGANVYALRYVQDIGAREKFHATAHPAFPFMDIKSGERWTLKPDSPLWIFHSAQRTPQTSVLDYLRVARLAIAKPEHTVGRYFGKNERILTHLLEPLTVAALNTPCDEASAKLLWQVINACFLGGESAAVPYVARTSLAEALVDPALALLQAKGAEIHYHHCLQGLEAKGDKVCALRFPDKTLEIADGDSIILALPPHVLPDILPQVEVPQRHNAIVNGHFLWPKAIPEAPPFMGVIHGTAQWIFRRENIISTTTSAASVLAERDADTIAGLLWKDICKAYDLGDAPLPAFHIIKEKRATFAATPENLAKRPPNQTAYRNLFLAGDYTDTRLPATLDSAVYSAYAAAEHCLEPL